MQPATDLEFSHPFEPLPPERRRDWRRVLALACGLAWLAAMVWWWFRIPPLGPAAGSQPASGSGAEVSAIGLQAETTSSSTMTTMRMGESVLPARSLWILGQSEDRLVQLVGRELSSQLHKSTRFADVRYLSPGELVSSDTGLPDLFATLDLMSLNEGSEVDPISPIGSAPGSTCV